jgi:formiminotetrahydrofolate cyclodeaminase
MKSYNGHHVERVFQLTMYKDKYEEFQATINRSNDMFQKLKSEMDKVGCLVFTGIICWF